ncbi:hypothetical protein TELCIR_21058 [Teladorsagia circumcincta]|uniref:Uncharacterized protein n=1 Tax=Teladorsagia circumcincta TaxID=45464 RepID=A0A2G9TI07_TELCI|nr:hypothetical protein TELCIR_21058 [Teladorsagia circumcincta]
MPSSRRVPFNRNQTTASESNGPRCRAAKRRAARTKSLWHSTQIPACTRTSYRNHRSCLLTVLVQRSSPTWTIP